MAVWTGPLLCRQQATQDYSPELFLAEFRRLAIHVIDPALDDKGVAVHSCEKIANRIHLGIADTPMDLQLCYIASEGSF